MLRSHHLCFIYFTAIRGEKTMRYKVAVMCWGRRYRLLVGSAPWLRCLNLCFDFLTLHLYVTHTTGMPQLKIVVQCQMTVRHKWFWRFHKGNSEHCSTITHPWSWHHVTSFATMKLIFKVINFQGLKLSSIYTNTCSQQHHKLNGWIYWQTQLLK
jgi:hypothetical protein